MPLTDKQIAFYRNSMQDSKNQIADANKQIVEEQAKSKARIALLETVKRSSAIQYGAACIRLGIPNDLGDVSG